MSPTFRFTGRATAHDATGYYYPNWDRSVPVSVIAGTKQEAMDKAAVMLGKGQFGRWMFRWSSIDEVADIAEAGA